MRNLAIILFLLAATFEAFGEEKKTPVKFNQCQQQFLLGCVSSFIVSHYANIKKEPTPDQVEQMGQMCEYLMKNPLPGLSISPDYTSVKRK